jgi:PhoPQ-activated pathogenicity-related protein
MAPIVFDLLNLRQNLMHHYQSLGGWTFAFGKSNIYALFLVSTDDAMLFIILLFS